jgi:hypothetical protein
MLKSNQDHYTLYFLDGARVYRVYLSSIGIYGRDELCYHEIPRISQTAQCRLLRVSITIIYVAHIWYYSELGPPYVLQKTLLIISVKG